jgi:hypothetical protein
MKSAEEMPVTYFKIAFLSPYITLPYITLPYLTLTKTAVNNDNRAHSKSDYKTRLACDHD